MIGCEAERSKRTERSKGEERGRDRVSLRKREIGGVGSGGSGVARGKGGGSVYRWNDYGWATSIAIGANSWKGTGYYSRVRDNRHVRIGTGVSRY